MVINKDLNKLVQVLSGSVADDSEEDFLVIFREHLFKLLELELALSLELGVDLVKSGVLHLLSSPLEYLGPGIFRQVLHPLRDVFLFGLVISLAIRLDNNQILVGFEDKRHLGLHNLGELGLASLEKFGHESLVSDELGVLSEQ